MHKGCTNWLLASLLCSMHRAGNAPRRIGHASSDGTEGTSTSGTIRRATLSVNNTMMELRGGAGTGDAIRWALRDRGLQLLNPCVRGLEGGGGGGH